MLVAMNNHNVVVSLRKGGLWLAPLLALLLVGCKDPYSDKPGNFPPPVDDRNKQFGSLQQVYQQPKLTPATRTAPSGSVSRTTVALGKNPIFYGDPDAPVTIVEFSDFEWPFCSSFGKVAKQIVRANPGNVRLVFRHHPLSFHKDAHLAHQASLAARAQGKFWEYHDLLFQNQRKLKKKDLISYAKKLKLDVKKFQEALDKKTHAKEIDEELDYGKELKVPGTPTTYVNGRQVNIGKGKKPKEVLEELVKDELERVKELQKKGLKGNKLYYELVGQPDDSSDKKDSKSKKQKEYKYIAIGDSPTKGDDDAQVTLVEFSDFTCGFCSGAAKTLGQIARAYKGKVQIVFKNFPLSQGNYDIAQAALAAHQQGKFWEYHDLVFNNQSKVDRDSLIAHAKSLELDVELFKRTMDSPATKAHVDADVKQGRELKLQGTPSFFLNNRPLGALQGFDSFMKELNKELIKKGYKKEDLPSGPPPAVIAMGDSPYKGLKNAPVSIVEFSDFQWPYCSRAGRQLKQFASTYKGKVNFVFKHFPLSFHKEAHLAHQASVEAQQQGKFWEYHDKLFANQSKLKRHHLEQYAQEIGLDMARFKAALDNKTHFQRVANEILEGGQAGVGGTPTVFVNGVKASGTTFSDLKKVVDPILIKKGYKKSELPDEPAVSISMVNVPYKGPENAPVTIVEYSDFQWPFCSRAGSLLKQFASSYKGKVKFVFKHYPLSFHKDAHLAHQASVEAQEQGKFWEYHDALFDNQRKLKRKDLERYARQVGLDMTRFRAALDGGKHKARVDAELAEGTAAGVGGTPTVFINGKKTNGYKFEDLKKVVDPILVKKGYKLEDLPTGVRHEIKMGNAPMKGPRKAPITIVEFSDFECPFCSIAGLNVPKLLKLYPGLVNVAFKHFPLSFHKNAPLAHQASLAAQEQGQFWEYHDLLFKNQRQITRSALERYAQQLKLNMPRFKQALDSGIFQEQVSKDIKQGGGLGVSGTPSFFINGAPAKSPRFKDLVADVEKELRRLKIKSPVSKAKLKELGVDLSAKKPQPRPVLRVVPTRVAPPARRAAQGQCAPGGKGGAMCAPPKR